MSHLLFASLLATAPLGWAQEQAMPSEINGQWTFQRPSGGGPISNKFSLNDIKVAPDKSFSAKLTWWTAVPSCAIVGDPVSGTANEKGLTWEFTTKGTCRDPYVAELARADKGWEGKVTGKNNGVSAPLKAE
jgi:hypothetical protein